MGIFLLLAMKVKSATFQLLLLSGTVPILGFAVPLTLGMARANQLLTFTCQASYHPANHRETADAEDFIPRLDSGIRESWDEPDRQEEAGRASNQ
jgi:hypothetical protein